MNVIETSPEPLIVSIGYVFAVCDISNVVGEADIVFSVEFISCAIGLHKNWSGNFLNPLLSISSKSILLLTIASYSLVPSIDNVP